MFPCPALDTWAMFRGSSECPKLSLQSRVPITGQGPQAALPPEEPILSYSPTFSKGSRHPGQLVMPGRRLGPFVFPGGVSPEHLPPGPLCPLLPPAFSLLHPSGPPLPGGCRLGFARGLLFTIHWLLPFCFLRSSSFGPKHFENMDPSLFFSNHHPKTFFY